MASIEKRGEGWRVRWKTIGGQRRARQCSTERTARKLQAEIDACLELGRDWHPEDPSAVPDLATVFSAYLTSASRRLRPGTLRQMDHALRGYLKSLRRRRPKGTLGPDLLTRSSLGSFYDDLLETCSPHTAMLRTLIVARAWAWAYDSDDFGDVVPRNRKPEIPDVPHPAVTVAPTWAEMDAVVEASIGRGRNGWRHRLFLLLRYTGLRLSQVMHLEWRDLDFEQGLLTVRPELGKTKAERKGRVIPVTRHLIALAAGWGRRDGYLVPGGGEARDVDWETSRAIIEAAALRRYPGETEEAERARAAFLSKFPSPHHSFRHGFITGLVVAGVPERAVQILVGHAGGGITRSTYTDAWQLLPELRAAVEHVPQIGAAAVTDLDARRSGASGAHPVPTAKLDGA